MTSVTAAHENAQHQQRKGKGRSRAGERDHPVLGTALRDRPRAGLLRDLARRRAAATVHRMVAGHPGRLERRLDPLHPAGGLRSHRIARRARPRGTHSTGQAGHISAGGPGPACPGRPGPAGPGWPAHRGGRRRGPRAVVAASLLAAGVVCGIAGLFPGYLSGVSLAQAQPTSCRTWSTSPSGPPARC